MIDGPRPPYPHVASGEFPGHIVALLGPRDRQYLVDLTAGQYWSDSPFRQVFEAATRAVHRYDAEIEVGPPARTIGVHYLNNGVYVAIRSRDDLPVINLELDPSHISLALRLLSDGDGWAPHS